MPSFATPDGTPLADLTPQCHLAGPGCSSVAGGAMSELGPFFPSKNGRGLIVNEFAWNSGAGFFFLFLFFFYKLLISTTPGGEGFRVFKGFGVISRTRPGSSSLGFFEFWVPKGWDFRVSAFRILVF